MTATVTSVSSLGDNQSRLKLRELCIYLLLISLFTLIGTLMWIILRYALPQPKLVLVGNLADFPPSNEPYHYVNEKVDVYIVNTENKLLALIPQTPNLWQCNIRWVNANNRFEEPCLGAKFALTGAYLFGPGVRGLDRYPVRMTDTHQLLVDLSQVIIESKEEWFNDCITFYGTDQPIPPASPIERWSGKSDTPLAERHAVCTEAAEQHSRAFRTN
ncbi:MAG: hypothetical protein U0350_08625 [Caldilineaceae bacterium]